MANPFFSGRIPQDLDNRVTQHCTETGESKTDVLIKALGAYLNHPVSRPTTAPSVFEERFTSVEEQVASLQLAFKKFVIRQVINIDNKNEFQPQDAQDAVHISDPTGNANQLLESQEVNSDNKLIPDIKLDKISDISTSDNLLDNTNDNSINDLKEDLKLAKVNDNKLDDGDNNLETYQPVQILPPEVVPKSFENLNSVELTALTGLKQTQLDTYKGKISKRRQKIERPLESKQLLEAPEKVEAKQTFIIQGYPYDLFYLGQNEKGSNLWTALPYDSNRYQQLSIQTQINEQVSADPT